MNPIQKFFVLIHEHGKKVLIASAISVIVALMSILSAFVFGKITDQFTGEVLSGSVSEYNSEEEEIDEDTDEHHSESPLHHFAEHAVPVLKQGKIGKLLMLLAGIWLLQTILQYAPERSPHKQPAM